MKKIYEIALSAVMLLTLAGCTLMLDVLPEEEEKPQEEVDLDKVGFDEPYTQVMEDVGTCTFQYGDSTKVFVRELFDYIVAVESDTAIILSDNVPADLLIQPGYYVSHGCCLEFPSGLCHKVTGLTKRQGTYRMELERANKAKVFKELSVNLSTDLVLSNLTNELAEELKKEISDAMVREGLADLEDNYVKKKIAPSDRNSNSSPIDWCLFDNVEPISTVSPLYPSIKKRMPATRGPKRVKDVVNKDSEQEILAVKIIGTKTLNVSVGGWVSGDLQFEKYIKLKDEIKEILDKFTFILTATQHTKKRIEYTEEVRDGSTYKHVEDRDESKTNISVTLDYTAKSLDGGEELIKKAAELKKQKLAGMLEWLGRAVIVSIPVPACPAVHILCRLRVIPDMVFAGKAVFSVDYDYGTTLTVTDYIDDTQLHESEKTTIVKGKGLTNWKFLMAGYIKFSLDVEALVGGGTMEPGVAWQGAGAGAYINNYMEFDYTVDFNSLINAFSDDTQAQYKQDKYFKNPMVFNLQTDVYARGAVYNTLWSGKDEWYHDINSPAITYAKRSYHRSPQYSKFDVKYEMSDRSTGIYDELNVSYVIDDLGWTWNGTYPDNISEVEAGANVYECDADGDPTGAPIRELDGRELKINDPTSWVIKLQPSEMDKSFVVVPTVRYKKKTGLWKEGYLYRDLMMYEKQKAEKRAYPQLKVIDLKQLSGVQLDEFAQEYKFDFQFNAYNQSLMQEYWPGGVQLMLVMWVYDEQTSSWKYFRQKTLQLSDKLVPSKEKYDIICDMVVSSSKKRDYAVSAYLFHGLSLANYLHYVEDGVNKYENHDIIGVGLEKTSGFVELKIGVEDTPRDGMRINTDLY